MTILKRLRNLWRLAAHEPVSRQFMDGSGRRSSHTVLDGEPEAKPKGMARIVSLENPIVDHFKD